MLYLSTIVCGHCDGTGLVTEVCTACDGVGQIGVTYHCADREVQCEIECSTCEGEGEILDLECGACRGDGQVEVDE